MEINNDIENILEKIKNTSLLWDGEDETKILLDRINISFQKFILIYDSIEKQYNRCLKYASFNLENEMEKTLNEEILKFININELYEKYKIMQKIDNIIIYNIIYD